MCKRRCFFRNLHFQTDNIDRSNILWYQQPAGRWTEALPVGNGRLGGMVYGSVQTEHIQLNEDTFWSGDKVDRNNPKSLENLPKIRSLLFERKHKEALELADNSMLGIPRGLHSYQPLGDLYIQFHDIIISPNIIENLISTGQL